MVMMLSKPGNYDFRPDELLTGEFGLKFSKGKVYQKILRELQEAGHARYRRNADGTTEWDVFENPAMNPDHVERVS